MLNIQDVSHLSKKEQKAYNRFVESVEIGNLPVLPCIEMDLKEMKEETLNQSKIGGMPFLKSFKDIPLDENNVPMVLLAQINLDNLPEQQELFPVKEGILQFWISSEDQMYGMSENLKGNNINLSSSVLEYKMTKCTSKWTTFFILTYIPNYIQNDL